MTQNVFAPPLSLVTGLNNGPCNFQEEEFSVGPNQEKMVSKNGTKVSLEFEAGFFPRKTKASMEVCQRYFC